MIDCLVVGGGPAGATAAIYLARFRRSVLVLDEGKSRCSWIPTTRNHPGHPDGIHGSDLLDRMRAQARRYGARVEPGSVQAVLPMDGGGFIAALADGRRVEASTLLLATGVIDDQPKVPDLFDAVQRGLIRVCPICDGYEVIDRRIGVIGHGAHAAGEALFMRTYTPYVTLLTLGEPMQLSAEMRVALDRAGVAVEEEPAAGVTIADGRITHVVLRSGREHAFDTLYSALGTLARSALAAELGAAMDECGRLIVDGHQRCSVPGVFAAGDIVSTLNQISVAMGEAAKAATAIHNDLRRREGMTTETLVRRHIA